MSNNLPKTHLFSQKDLPLHELPQIYSVGSIWLEKGMENIIATYDVTVRDLPKNRNFMVLTGIEEVVSSILDLKFQDEEIEYLRKHGIITSTFSTYMKKFKFSGDVFAMPEGSIFFPGEPIIRITAPIIEGNMLSTLLMNTITSNTIFSTKSIRFVIAAKNKTIIGPGGMRGHSYESCMKCARASYIVGTKNAMPNFFRKYNLKQDTVITIAYHAYIKSFPTEIEAMRTIAKEFPFVSLMVDTYDFDQGVKNAIIVAKELKENGKVLTGIVIDSGDLYELCVKARKMFDDAGLRDIKITLASNLNEFKIHDLVARNVPADAFLVVTEGITVSDDPKLEVVYKIAEMCENDKVTYTAKLTPGKLSLPGKKQIFRVYTKEGNFDKDIIGLEGEKLGEPLLRKYIDNGKMDHDLPDLDVIKKYVTSQIQKLPKDLLDINKVTKYQVKISDSIEKIMDDLRESHIK